MTPDANAFAHPAAANFGLAPSAARALAADLGLVWVDVATLAIPAKVLGLVDGTYAQRRTVLPIAFARGVLRLAVADPLALDVVDEVAYAAGVVVQPVVTSVGDLQAAIVRHYGGTDEITAATAAFTPVVAEASDGESVDGGEADALVIRVVQRLIAEASRRRASDIHLEPLARRFRVRYRIDGVLLEVDAPPRRLQPAVISRIKIMANLSIAEKRLPQDGRIPFESDGRLIDLRVSTLPTSHGESIVMRLLDQAGLRVSLPELGFLPDHAQEFSRGITSADGIMLVTGPTGSGKTTTLYAGLTHLNHRDRKIITVEDPVEYQIAGINQVPVNATTGLTFAAALRAMLRQAPNVVMVGEIRDQETAETALQAALTGHMVFSTLHTNDAPGAVIRLIELGAKSFLVAAALRSVVAQRLVRRVCADCKRAYQPAPREFHALGLSPSQIGAAEFTHGVGCARCHGTGYQGRVGIFELLPATEMLRALIYDNVTAAHLRTCARAQGMRTLREDGVRKVLAGLTTISEVVAVTVGDSP